MKFRLVSDIHQEFIKPKLFKIPEGDEDCLIIAGDFISWGSVAYSTLGFELLAEVCDKFKHVVYVFGNHEFYGSNIKGCIDNVRAITYKLKNLYILDNQWLQIEGYTIIGSTLWGDVEQGDTLSEKYLLRGMSDFSYIENYIEAGRYNLFKPSDMYNLYKTNYAWLDKTLHLFEFDMDKTVVVTHHLPHQLSIHPKYAGSRINGGFLGDCSQLINQYQPAVWCHGHTHDSFNYCVGKTRIVCNPRGYVPFENNPLFNPNFQFELL